MPRKPRQSRQPAPEPEPIHVVNDAARRAIMAHKVATPIIAISTPDQPAMIEALLEAEDRRAEADRAAGKPDETANPIMWWSLTGGIEGKEGTIGEQAAKKLDGGGNAAPGTRQRGMSAPKAIEVLRDKAPLKSTLCIVHAGHELDNPPMQSMLTMSRETLMGHGKTVILLGADVTIPAGLQHDVMALHDPLPSDDEIKAAIGHSWDAVKYADDNLPAPTDEEMSRAVSGMRGLSAFEVGQASTMTLVEHRKLDAGDLMARRNAMIDGVQGLSVDRFDATFSDIRGIGRARWFGEQLFGGPESPSVIVRIDELEKKMGDAHDFAGGATKGDELQVLLTEMEDNGWSGCIAYGPPGSGKTLWTQAMGPTFDVQTINLDFGATRNKFVGESEANIRAALRTIKAIGGNRVYIVATCNELESLKPELRRRFADGVYFFDLPSDEERADLWKLYRAKYKIDGDERKALGLPVGEPDPYSDGWTGAEIRNACRLAWRLRVSLADAAAEQIPVVMADPDGIERRRQQADGRYKSASYAGVYRMDRAAKPEAAPGGRLLA